MYMKTWRNYNKKSAQALCTSLKQYFLSPHIDIEQDAKTDHIRRQRTHPIAHQRQGNTGYGHDAHRHADIDQDVES